MLVSAMKHSGEALYDGAEALKRSTDTEPEILILDLGMPGLVPDRSSGVGNDSEGAPSAYFSGTYISQRSNPSLGLCPDYAGSDRYFSRPLCGTRRRSLTS
jgi:hypothetical protein